MGTHLSLERNCEFSFLLLSFVLLTEGLQLFILFSLNSMNTHHDFMMYSNLATCHSLKYINSMQNNEKDSPGVPDCLVLP